VARLLGASILVVLALAALWFLWQQSRARRRRHHSSHKGDRINISDVGNHD
jgi:hypothetical protein